MDFSAPLNPKMAMIIFSAATIGGFLFNRSIKLIIGMVISLVVAVMLFLIFAYNPYIHLDADIVKHIETKFYYSWIDKPKGIWQAIIHTELSEIPWKKTFKPLIGLAGFGFGFVVLGKLFGEPKPPKKK